MRPRVRLAPKDTLAVVLQTRFKAEVLVAFETLVAHDFPHNFLNVSHPHGKVLVPIPAVHTHVKALDEPVLDGISDPLVNLYQCRRGRSLAASKGQRYP